MFSDMFCSLLVFWSPQFLRQSPALGDLWRTLPRGFCISRLLALKKRSLRQLQNVCLILNAVFFSFGGCNFPFRPYKLYKRGSLECTIFIHFPFDVYRAWCSGFLSFRLLDLQMQAGERWFLTFQPGRLCWTSAVFFFWFPISTDAHTMGAMWRLLQCFFIKHGRLWGLAHSIGHQLHRGFFDTCYHVHRA